MRFVRSGSPRIVIDTNVLVSATIRTEGASARILDAFRSGKIRLVLSGLLLIEFDDVIHRARIANRYPETVVGADAFIEFFKENALWVEGFPKRRYVPIDVKDDIVIACAIEGDADYIVSGDRHLLDLKQIAGILILSPAVFVKRFKF